MTSPLTVYVLGSSGSGKTNLLRQLGCMCETGTLLTRPTHDAPTQGQEVHSLVLEAPQKKAASCTVELRELGGEMAPVWEKFIRSWQNSLKGNSGAKSALIFLVDALSPHLLPMAPVMFSSLKGSDGACRGWPTAVLLNKALAKNAMTEAELEFFLSMDACSDAQLLVVDSWNGLGLGDVMEWLSSAALSQPTP
ncbi:ADP-ribosylation factor-like protein 16 [Trypanosoma conorhini]|uniref:ADP-ribosylation factor-like protein 16 n=1 Tax=Trypanosoma conorhini TaxID=83891 RepID=A0A3R7PXZ5_9TRYP|nr:ADP-ribosylation factor-like protein 16 [Trypanosoma conorhini]RNF26956.1 ADP-ribosylation factor-like protein 16 [Trypanosoma conorhini]